MAEGLHLSSRHRKEIEALLHKHLPGVEVWAYGSRVNGRSHDGSDLDLVLRSPKLAEIDISRIADFIEALQDSTIPFLVEVRDWARLPESFHCEIERAHAVLAAAALGEALEGRNVGVADEWRATTIGGLLAADGGSVKTGPFGTALKAKEYSKVGVPLISVGEVGYGSLRLHEKTPRAPREVVERLPEYLLEAGDIVFGRKGAVDRSALVKPNQAGWFLGSDGIRLRLPTTCDSRFIAYQLQGEVSRLWLLHHATGTTMASLNQEIIERVPIVLPPIEQQRAIAHILGTLDDKIELNRRMNETLEAMARALFKSWFVDFDPVRAKMEGRDTGLPKRLADLFPDRLVESELGKIPEGWEVKALDEIAVFQNGLALQKHRPQTNEERLPVVKIAQLRSGKTDSGEWATSNIRPECIIRDGDVVFSWSGSLMVTVWCSGRAALNQHLFKVTSTRFPKWFFLNNVRSHLADFQTIAAGKATTMGHIKRHHLTAAKCVVPTWQILSSVDNTFSSLLSKTISLSLKSLTLVGLRDTLLPKLVSGQLRVVDNCRPC